MTACLRITRPSFLQRPTPVRLTCISPWERRASPCRSVPTSCARTYLPCPVQHALSVRKSTRPSFGTCPARPFLLTPQVVDQEEAPSPHPTTHAPPSVGCSTSVLARTSRTPDRRSATGSLRASSFPPNSASQSSAPSSARLRLFLRLFLLR